MYGTRSLPSKDCVAILVRLAPTVLVTGLVASTFESKDAVFRIFLNVAIVNALLFIYRFHLILLQMTQVAPSFRRAEELLHLLFARSFS